MSQIIKLDEGFGRLQKDGIQPFLKFLEDQEEKQFFKASEFVKYYDLVYCMCNQPAPHDYSGPLYEKYSGIIADYCNDTVKKNLEAARARFEMAFLNEWRVRWHKFKLATKGVAKVFQYLDRFWTKEKEGTLDLGPQAFKIFKELVFDKYAPIARQTIIHCVEKERNGEDQDRDLLRDAVNVFVEMGFNWKGQKLNLYRDELEKQIVVDAGAYYKRYSPTWVDQDATPVYLERAEKMMAAETKRVEAYLNRISLEPLLAECYLQLLKAHQKDLIDKKTGVRSMLDQNAKTDLTRMYTLYKRAPDDLNPIAAAVEKYVMHAGKTMVDQAKPAKKKKEEDKKEDGEKEGGDKEKPAEAEGKAEKPKGEEKKAEAPSVVSGLQLVQNLIALHHRFDGIVEQCFQKAMVFQKAIKTAFTEFINADSRVSLLLAQFVHDLLQKGSRFKVEDLEETLKHVAFIYGYIREKDVFEMEFQKYLARRLLEGTSRSEHTEKSLIGKLKVEAGFSWVGKLEGMFKDVANSTELNNLFRTVYQDKSMEMHVTVCSKANWPPTKLISGRVPRELAPPCEAFKKFYKEKQSMHKIDWMWDLGQAECMVKFRPGYNRTLCCSTLQMLLLLVFNNPSKASGILTAKELIEITGVKKEDVADHLVSMAVPSVGLLDKLPKNKELEDDHKFRLNKEFKSQLMKVVVPIMRGLVPDLKKPGGEGPDPLKLQRQHMIDAGLVRVMKVRQTFKHSQLMAEVIGQLKQRFDPKPADIRRRIDYLIDCPEPYMRRDEKDRSVLHYIP